MRLLKEEVLKKWEPILNNESVAKITDPYRRWVTAVLLENQLEAGKSESEETRGFLTETLPANSVGTGGYGGGAAAGGPVAGFDPILISLVRRSLPNLIAYDVCGVQPMTGP